MDEDSSEQILQSFRILAEDKVGLAAGQTAVYSDLLVFSPTSRKLSCCVSFLQSRLSTVSSE